MPLFHSPSLASISTHHTDPHRQHRAFFFRLHCDQHSNKSRRAEMAPHAAVAPVAAPSVKTTTKPDDLLWTIHGQKYDLTSYVNRHPGGSHMILLGQGRDCTELVESMHALTPETWRKILDKYRVEPIAKADALPVAAKKGGAPREDVTFAWDSDDTFYAEVKRRVRAYFATTKQSHHATWSFWAWALPLMVATFAVDYFWITTAWTPLSFVTGVLYSCMGFYLMHTASHFGLSHKVWVNEVVSEAWCNSFAVWRVMWSQHHHEHHAHTGVTGQDPDLTNYYPLVRKHSKTPWKPVYKWQKYVYLPMALALPNLFLGQAISYVRGAYKGKVFGMKLTNKTLVRPIDRISVAFFTLLSAFLHLGIPAYLHGMGTALVQGLCLATAIGVMFWAITFPNHDTAATQDHKVPTDARGRRDWGAQQVLSSSNFEASTLVTCVLGGMNYQIEHHLFPTMHPAHHPAVSEIVKKVCRERGIGYVCHSSWFSAFASYNSWIVRMGLPDDATRKAPAS